METGAAKPFYEKTIELATDSVKFKKELLESYQYLGKYYIKKDDIPKAKEIYKKVLEFDPADIDAPKVLNSKMK